MQAAVAAGADAVYFGVDAFNARQRAENFRIEDLPAVMRWLHDREVLGFLTFNVLVFSDELDQAAELLIAADQAGVDAAIVQDVGICTLASRLVPRLPLHGSTQMSITSAAGIAQAAALGCQRVVLARELSVADLGRLQGQLRDRHLRMPLEVFVHGALCVAYSGQCLTSESLGQRSANRGECAQACRLPYELVVDGRSHPMEDQRYLLSPQDLAAWELLPELQRLGIASLKIEGRLKDATYVSAVTQAYRQRLDQSEQEPEVVRRQLELAFSRGLSTGWLKGVNHRQLVHGRWSKKRGPLVGRLLQVDRGGWLEIRSRERLRPGQGLVLEVLSEQPLIPPQEIGGRVMAVERRGAERLHVRLGPGRLNTRILSAGASVWLTSDPQWESRWQKAAHRPVAAKPRDLELIVNGCVGEPLEVRCLHREVAVRSRLLLQTATQRALDQQRLEEQLGRLGGTRWRLTSLTNKLEGACFLPVAELNRMRRTLLQALENSEQDGAADLIPKQELEPVGPPVPCITHARPESASPVTPDAGLVVLVRSLEQLQALIDLPQSLAPVRMVIADLEQPKQLREAVVLGRGRWPDGIWLTGARITRPDERWSLEPLIRARPDGYLVRNADQLETLTPLAPCIGDFSLNTANPLSFRWYQQHWGLIRLSASYDLNLQQLLNLAVAVEASSLEVTLHQHMPMFHMEHCLFCAFLSDGHNHTDCGRPCEKHTVSLRDRSGVEHSLRADLGCRNTVFNATAQTGVEGLPALLNAGVRHFRIELLAEDPEATVRRVCLYADALSGRLPSRDVWRQEKIDHQLGVTRGSLSVRGPERTSQMNR